MLRLSILAVSLFASSTTFAADAVLPIAAAPAAPHISGYGEIYLGGLQLSEFGEDDNIHTGGGAGRVNIPFAQQWNVQLDGTYDRLWEDGDFLDGLGGAVHAYYRDPQRFAVGLFATYKRYGNNFSDDVHDYTVGPEAQAYFGNLTLYGQAYYGKIDDGFDNVAEWGVRGVARYFVQPNLRFDGEIAFNRVGEDFADFDTISFAAQAMYRFEGTPWSLFGRYQYDRTSIESETISTNKYLIGLRASFGSGTLFDEDRNSATMDTYRPNFVVPFAEVR